MNAESKTSDQPTKTCEKWVNVYNHEVAGHYVGVLCESEDDCIAYANDAPEAIVATAVRIEYPVPESEESDGQSVDS